ncbi:hypothetical protein V5799_006219 [Amblyomma americanum]|uniref:Uncharacterized protein n=1 Tax=Amblyomma americanum TaxID=6943 RepID=A0AAQ4DX09_AMBAM
MPEAERKQKTYNSIAPVDKLKIWGLDLIETEEYEYQDDSDRDGRQEFGFTFRQLPGLPLTTSSMQLLVTFGAIVLAVAITLMIFGMVGRIFDSPEPAPEAVDNEKHSIYETRVVPARSTAPTTMTVLESRDRRNVTKASRKHLLNGHRKHATPSPTTRHAATGKAHNRRRAPAVLTTRGKGLEASRRHNYGKPSTREKVATEIDYRKLILDYENVIAVLPEDYDLDFANLQAPSTASTKSVVNETI